MNITELDEWQGITADMVREWLKRTGWELRTDEWGEKRWFNGNGRSIADKRVLVTDGFRWIASQSVQTVQALLREINPRMRKGWPSGEALAMHDRWIVSKPEGVVIMCRWRPPYMVNAAGGGDLALREQCEHWSFWPCDANGNKVRWPEKDGVML